MRRLAVAVGAVLVLVVGGVAWAAIPNADGNIYACYSTGDGSVRVKDDPAKPCAKGWAPLSWTAGQPDVPVTTTYRVQRNVNVPANGGGGAVVECNDGDVATGGGHAMLLGSSGYADQSFPPGSTPPDSWLLHVINTTDNDTQAALFVVCQHTE